LERKQNNLAHTGPSNEGFLLVGSAQNGLFKEMIIGDCYSKCNITINLREPNRTSCNPLLSTALLGELSMEDKAVPQDFITLISGGLNCYQFFIRMRIHLIRLHMNLACDGKIGSISLGSTHVSCFGSGLLMVDGF
jgi:hypothetical protein